MKKFIILILLLACTAFLSYRYSSQVYNFFLRSYLNGFYNEDSLRIKISDMHDKKKYVELESFLNSLMTIYPDNNEFKKAAVFNYLKLGNAAKSAELIAAVDDQTVFDSKTVELILKELYEKGDYADLVFFYEKGFLVNSVNPSLYYGIALYKAGRYEESYRRLVFVSNNTFMFPELSYYLGMDLDKMGRSSEALEFLKEAYEKDRRKQEYKKGLMELYRKRGLFREAERLMRGG